MTIDAFQSVMCLREKILLKMLVLAYFLFYFSPVDWYILTTCVCLMSYGCSIKRNLQILIYSADPQSRQVVIIVFAHVVRPSVRPHFSTSSKTKQISNENYWRDCGSGRVDYWYPCLVCTFFLRPKINVLQLTEKLQMRWILISNVNCYNISGALITPETHFFYKAGMHLLQGSTRQNIVLRHFHF